MTSAVLGIIGGSGIYDLPGLENVRNEAIESPWGEPSAPLRRGTLAGLPIVFFCHATARGTFYRPPTSITEPISMC